MMRQQVYERRAASSLLTALAVLLPLTNASVRGGSSVATSIVAAGRVGAAIVTREGVVAGTTAGFSNNKDERLDLLRRRMQEIDECTEKTSVGDAEAGIAIYEDEEACDREGPLVGCNGECYCLFLVFFRSVASFQQVASVLSFWLRSLRFWVCPLQ